MLKWKSIFKTRIFWLFFFASIMSVNHSALGMSLAGPEPVISPGPLGAPVRIVSYSAGLLLVSDYSNGKIFKVNKNDLEDIQLLFTIEGRALAIGHFGKNIIVGNTTTGNVELYDKKGNFRKNINSDAPIARPSDLAVDMNMIFVVDSRQHQIKVYSKKKLLATFGSSELVNPVGIALDRANQIIYVSDHGDSVAGIPAAVFVFTYEGVPIDKLESADFGFDRPRGIAFNLGNLYITDALLGVVSVIDVDNKVALGELGSYGSGPGQLIQPQDVEIAQDGTEIYVANKRLGRVEKISTGGQ